MNKLLLLELHFFRRKHSILPKNGFILFLFLSNIFLLLKTQRFKLKTILKKTTILALSLFTLITFSQNSDDSKVVDSLKNNNYDELASLFYKNQNDSIKAFKYANLYLIKAKSEKNIIRTASAYSLFTTICKRPQYAIKYADSIINTTKNIKNNKIYPALGYIQKGILNEFIGNYKKALSYYLIANKLALKNKNQEQILYIQNQIGQLKLFWGDPNEALGIFKAQLSLITNKKEVFHDKNDLYLNTLFSISNAYIVNKKYDSALYFSNKGLNNGFKNNHKDQYHRFLSQTGEILYYKNDLKRAHDSIVKAFPFENSYNAQFNSHYILGSIFKKQNNEIKAFYHLTKADSIYNLTKDMVPEVRDIQEYFINYYKERNDIKNQLKYINKLLKVDSIINSNKLTINKTIQNKYDTPLLLSEKQQLITTLTQKTKTNLYVIWGLLIFSLFGILLIIRVYIKQRSYKKRFRRLLLEKNEGIKKTANKNKKTVETNSIANHINDAIILELEKFEASKGYLNNKITLKSLALKLNTNTTYLSKCINIYKEKNFSSYITDLRIDYCIEKLKNDTTYRKYTIKAIASEVGYNNSESFSKAFYKKTGIYPSYFVKELEKQ